MRLHGCAATNILSKNCHFWSKGQFWGSINVSTLYAQNHVDTLTTKKSQILDFFSCQTPTRALLSSQHVLRDLNKFTWSYYLGF